MSVSTKQRFTLKHPCPVCGGHEQEPHGQGKRCYGFLSDDGEYACCTREELAGSIQISPNSNTFAHRLSGPCKCDTSHASVVVPSIAKTTPSEAARYIYTDEHGDELSTVHRYEPKAFKQSRPSGNGERIWNIAGVRKVPYRLPELEAAAAEELMLITEGEKDCDRLSALGLIATTNPGGAGKWPADFARYFDKRIVAVIADNDNVGRRHAEAVAASLHKVAICVKVIHLPGLPEKGDVSDWLDAGHGVDELLTIVEESPAYEGNGGEGEKSREYLHCTDMGNGYRFAQLHQCNVRYSYASRKWYQYDGRRWAEDSGGHAKRLAKETAISILNEAAKCEDDHRRRELTRWATKSESDDRLEAMLRQAASELSTDLQAFDAEPMLLNCANGTLDLRTGELREHRRRDLLTKLVPVTYDPDAAAPTWDAFLTRVMGGNEPLINFLRRAIGYSLTGDVSERALFILYGIGANGKSVFVETIHALLADYARRTPTSTLMAKREGAVPNDIARLKGARFVHASESEEGRRLAEAEIKDLTGGDTISARFMRAEWFDFKPEFKLWLRTNHKPVVRGTDEGIWDRLKLIPFTVRIPDTEQDKQLPAKLRDELPGILAWAVHGCLEWQQDDLGVPAEVRCATAAYRREQDNFSAFAEECCVFDSDAWTSARDLRDTYERWSAERGDKFLLHGNAFAERLQAFNCTQQKMRGVRGWRGVGLLSDDI